MVTNRVGRESLTDSPADFFRTLKPQENKDARAPHHGLPRRGEASMNLSETRFEDRYKLNYVIAFCHTFTRIDIF